MGDLTKEQPEVASAASADDSASSRPEPTKSSVQLLKETAELSDITAIDAVHPQPERNPQDSELKIEIADASKRGTASIETVYENAGIDKTISSVTPSATGAPAPTADHHPAEISNVQISIQSGRMNKLRDHSSNIFPAGIMGCRQNDELPSPRRFLDAVEAAQDNIGHIENTPRKASVRNDHGRNPLLGTGLGGDDDAAAPGGAAAGGASKRPAAADKKGPLGDNYETKVTAGSATRIPPGGYSHGLW